MYPPFVDRILPFVVVTWLASIAGGFAAWEVYDALPGAAPVSSAARSQARNGRWSLELYAHPRCPCTRATVRELAEILADATRPVDVRAVFVVPAGEPEGWERTQTWYDAVETLHATAVPDPGGAEIRRAGVTTSGTVVLTDPTGRVVFRGGVTRARGQAGISPGGRAVKDILAEKPARCDTAPVFGCALLAPVGGSEECQEPCQP
jgi:hypothetical protein